ncbi:MAG: hypothetical protein K6F49_10340 [Saccharofermentans sp.]|nr:hypothetical protein [Saccharofermentans sp.]
MKNIKMLSALVMAAMLLGSCGNTKETAPTTILTPAETEASREEITEESEEPSETTEELTGPVDLTLDNYFDIAPELSEWGMSDEAADIIPLVDMDYIESSYSDVFYVEDISDLASLTYFVNTYPLSRTSDGDHFFISVDLTSDIDLTGYFWAPIGIPGTSDHDQAFAGIFSGNGHTITGLTIDNDREDNGFFGDIYGATVCGLYLEDISISGMGSGVFAGHIEDVRFFDCKATGTLTDSIDSGSLWLFPMLDSEADSRFISCSLNITNSEGYVTEEEFTDNPYGEGQSNAMLDLYDPDGDGIFEYGEDYFGTN